MTIKYSTHIRNARLEAIPMGLSPKLLLYTGSPPTNPTDAATGTLIVQMDLPSLAFGPAVDGVKQKAGSWQATAVASGTIGYFRLRNSETNFTTMQGSVGTASADMILDSVSISAGQTLNLSAFTLTAGNA